MTETVFRQPYIFQHTARSDDPQNGKECFIVREKSFGGERAFNVRFADGSDGFVFASELTPVGRGRKESL